MKQLICEMCGSAELIKQDGVYVCQGCGTKYSVEEAKKMMIDGTVEVAGAVKVDKSDRIKNYLSMARKSYEAGNIKEAEGYCNKVLEVNDKDFEAWLLKGMTVGWQSTINNLRFDESVSYFSNAIENAPEDDLERVKTTISEQASDFCLAIMKLCCNNYSKSGSLETANSITLCLKKIAFFKAELLDKCHVTFDIDKAQFATIINNGAMGAWTNHVSPDFWNKEHPIHDIWKIYIKRGDCVIELLEAAIAFEEDVITYQNMIEVEDKLINSYSWFLWDGSWHKNGSLTDEAKKLRIDKIMEWHEAIKKIDPTYTIPERPESKSGGCYVATAVYGSYDCPQVWTLRRYRDNILAETRHGRAFIKTYYAISPTLVRWFGDTCWFKNMWRGKLDRMVERLQSEGIESTPYNDDVW